MAKVRARRSDIDCVFRALGRAAALALLSLGGTAVPARAEITPLSSQLTASSLADVEPLSGASVPDTDSDGTPDGQLRSLSVSTLQSDSAPDLAEAVTATASVVYTGDDLLTVEVFGGRSGTDSTIGSPGGNYDSETGFDLSFQNLAVGTITVDWVLTFDRPGTGTFTPFGIVVRRGGIIDSRGPSVPFDAQSGIVSGSETFDLTATNLAFYDLEIDFAMIGATSNLAEPESWDATFTVHTPPMTITPVPEPSAPVATAVGLATFGLLRLRFRGQASRPDRRASPRRRVSPPGGRLARPYVRASLPVAVSGRSPTISNARGTL
jgi:hypothetical protein